jgi:hypothetical protein
MNRLLAYVTSILIFLVVLELGARLVGLSPIVTINQFDKDLGWAKEPNTTTRKKTSEFDIKFAINSKGLRDDEIPYDKPAGEYRILVCGDSFTLGYTVDRHDLFVDLLERALQQSGAKAQVINGGTEGYSTDQEMLWLRQEGLKYQPDLVVLAFYQNDIYWNGQESYFGKGKPRLLRSGNGIQVENPDLKETERFGWLARHSALAGTWANLRTAMRYGETMQAPLANGQYMPREEWVVISNEPPFITDGYAYTELALRGFKKTLAEQKIPGLVALIPSREQVQDESQKDYATKFKLREGEWDPNLPTQKVGAICASLGLDIVDPLPELRAAYKKTQEPLYFAKDWHLNADGNRILADVLLKIGATNLPDHKITLSVADLAPPSHGWHVPTWLIVVGVLWLLLSGLYISSYKDEKPVQAVLKVGLMIASIVVIVAGLGALAKLAGPSFGRIIGIVVVAALLIFIIWKTAPKFGIIREVMSSFVNRGMWYMLPLLVGMLTLGSLLVVAASSPFIAPFIYTLF